MKDEPIIRKTISLPQSMWDDIGHFRKSERISTKAEAIRRLLQAALKIAD